MQRSTSKAILLGGLIAGTIDVGAASLINLVNPLRILRTIAAGLIGLAAARHGGIPVAALGLLLQWSMALIIAAIYVLAGRALPVLRTRWLLCGPAYGVTIFLVMNYVVLRLSALAVTPDFTAQAFAENVLAMLLFGTIVAWSASRYAPVSK